MSQPKPPADLRKVWEDEQLALKAKCITEDENWKSGKEELELIGAVEIRFINREETRACAGIFVFDYPHMDILYEKYKMVDIDVPYMPGYLAFRYNDCYLELINELRTKQPHLYPQVFFVNGNGTLHTRGFGLASHLGVLIDTPIIGIGKNLILSEGLFSELDMNCSMTEVKNAIKEKCRDRGDYYELRNKSGSTLGVAMIGSDTSSNPIYVSVGHRVSLQTAIELALELCEFRVPEPIRLAGAYCDEYLRVNHYEHHGTMKRRIYKQLERSN